MSIEENKKETRNFLQHEKHVLTFIGERESKREKESREKSKSPKFSITTMNTSPNRNSDRTEEQTPKYEIKSNESQNGCEIVIIFLNRTNC